MLSCSNGKKVENFPVKKTYKIYSTMHNFILFHNSTSSELVILLTLIKLYMTKTMYLIYTKWLLIMKHHAPHKGTPEKQGIDIYTKNS